MGAMRTWRRRRLLVGALAGVGAVVVLLFAAGWYLSGVLGCRGFEPIPPVAGVEVVAVTEGAITLRATGLANECGEVRDNWSRDGIWGIRWDGGFGLVGAIQSLDEAGGEVVREFSSAAGAPPPGTVTRLTHPFPVDPTRALGIDFAEVAYAGELGPLPAWATAGDHATWVIYVHGKGGQRTEGMRILRTAAALGMPGLLIDYRNDPGAPVDPTGKYGYGLTEWRDLEGAVRYALDHGARDVVLVGYSMGGGVVLSFLYESGLAGVVRGAILDAPMADFGATVDHGIREYGVPGPLAPLPRAIASVRYGIDWAAMDYVARAGELRTPLLLFHGRRDQTVPFGIAEELAAARPDLVQFEVFDEAEHTRSWGADPERYDGLVREFLELVAP
jgi:uncharacterized protein